VARASGVDRDERLHSPRLAYRDFEPARPAAPTGDVAARLELRGAELATTFTLLAELLGHSIRPAGTEALGCEGAVGAGRVESPRGATLCLLDLDGYEVEHVRLRTGSFANWPALAHAATGELLPDFPLINKSFELCYACTDR
jgi:Ni,Fe-hydrogenase III large subunit